MNGPGRGMASFPMDGQSLLRFIRSKPEEWLRYHSVKMDSPYYYLLYYVVLGPGRGMASFSMDGQSLYNNRKTTSSSDRTLINAFRNFS